MPKGTHFHQAHDAMSTDNKANPDERLRARDKQEFQQSEKSKMQDSQSEEDFIEDQDKKNEE